jgi:hypothetical protein
MALHEERAPFEEELARRAQAMGTSVPRLVLDAQTMDAGEHTAGDDADEADDAGRDDA